jgi:4-methylaminobutanoate oxidase (formaldehyde-forming)
LFSEQSPQDRLPKKAKCVIVGGGVIGSSVAYHLAKGGWNDIVLVEQGTLTSGTTWHAAGLIGMMRPTPTETRLSMYGRDLYMSLEAETGLSTGYKPCGSVSLAQTADRMQLYKRVKSRADAFGIEAEIISAAEANERMGGTLETTDLLGALWLPMDGTADPTMVTNSLAKGARMQGVQIFEGVEVTGFDLEKGAVKNVKTTEGTIETDYVVNCAGQWARQLGKLAGVTVPLHSAEHYYLTTHPIKGITVDTPVMRDPDSYTYYREWSGGLMVGGFEPVCKPVFSEGAPNNFQFQLFDFDWDQFDILMRGALDRIPNLATTEVHTTVNGPESFTPDGSAPTHNRVLRPPPPSSVLTRRFSALRSLSERRARCQWLLPRRVSRSGPVLRGR